MKGVEDALVGIMKEIAGIVRGDLLDSDGMMPSML
jgi:hypothetical protein